MVESKFKFWKRIYGNKIRWNRLRDSMMNVTKGLGVAYKEKAEEIGLNELNARPEELQDAPSYTLTKDPEDSDVKECVKNVVKQT